MEIEFLNNIYFLLNNDRSSSALSSSKDKNNPKILQPAVRPAIISEGLLIAAPYDDTITIYIQQMKNFIPIPDV